MKDFWSKLKKHPKKVAAGVVGILGVVGLTIPDKVIEALRIVKEVIEGLGG